MQFYGNMLNRLLEDKSIDQHNSHDFTNYKAIGSGGSSSVYVANWKDTSTIYAIKKCVDNKEVYLTNKANSHENIIQFRGVTKFEDEKKYSLVLEYADGGTLGKYLRNNVIEWENQLRFAKEITSAVLWLHDYKGIVHGDLHPNNILIHKDTIKLADFGRSCLKGSNCYNTEVWGVIPYVDPKMLDQTTPYKLNEKSDIYSLGVLFWELTSRSSFFNGHNDHHITLKILSGVREKPVPNTNVKFIGLYQKCWDQEPDERPNISQVNSVLNNIDSKNNNVLTVPGNEESKKTEFIHSCQIDLKLDLNKLCQQL
ncbi:kinase-like domain-containing protein [Rhizophagus clarus]|uniref:Kinase-like domain-containing protein n=1 Tax=Rhizophagus clarus TaxID=94130 RepID=A0A8H3QWV5_9GLOM|nr:kinase-like domain-containing protein [Rhizophagus clarus]